ncbi:MAG TPA: PaaI family thioesterase [Polyangiaceae bacterium]|nr:PaaI family thioesterase [Polyangiaceae bacterium]
MIALPGLAQCFVCGDKNEHGLKLKFAIAEDGASVVCEYAPAQQFVGFAPYVHGAVISAMFDEGCAWPIIYRTGLLCMTVQLNVTFKRPATVGKKLRLVTKELPSDSKSQRAFKAGGRLTDESGAVVATAEAIYVPLDPAASSEFFRRMSFEGSGVSASHFEGRAAAGRADG